MNKPGFIDLQVNGYAGIDFSDPRTTVDDVLDVAETLHQAGTIGFLATVTTRPREIMEQCVQTVTTAIKKQSDRAHVLGIHLEGPFISPEYGFRGAHPADAVIPPDLTWFKKLQTIASGTIRLVTLAPECEGAVPFIQSVAPEVVVSAGHTNCTYDQLRRAVRSGLSLATHIGNGCRQMIDRHNNPVVNLLACPEITLSFIPDGFHLPEAFIRMLFNCRPVEKLVVVSDAVRLAGMPPGKYITSAGLQVLLDASGRLSLASDPDVLAGSSSDMFRSMNYLASLGILSEEELWMVGFSNPLSILNIDPQDVAALQNVARFDRSTNQFRLTA